MWFNVREYLHYIYLLTILVYNILVFSSFSLSWGCSLGSLYAVGRTPRGLLPYVLINNGFLVEFDF